MLLDLFVGYVVVSEIVVIGALCLGFFFAKNCPEDERYEQLSPRVITFFTIIAFVAGVLLAPLAAPYFLWRLWGCLIGIKHERDYWTNIQRTHFELKLEPVHAANISEELRQFFEEQSAAPQALGFDLLGDHWMKNFDPFNSKARFWLAPDRTSLAEISETIETLSCEVLSFLDDGSVIVTVNCNAIEVFARMAVYGYHVRCHNGFEMDQLLRCHADHVMEVSDRVGVSVRAIDADRWQDYVRYNDRRYGQIHFEMGEKDCGPENCEFPSAKTFSPALISETELFV